ncbi:hypothetical protein ANANG_G00304450 [Anguilla anguilla]|uniref:trypsin n=1 Tax=Anguilla anguilla TaxID=7936 RepID=A0A9D3RIH2_ANGAN|nr:hypothetical protein ANANG_G00304450 [Anguilla anguilla]
MDAKLVCLLVLSALLVPAQLDKHGHGQGHGNGKKHGHERERGQGHGHGHGHGHGPGEKHKEIEKRKPVVDYDYEATDPPSEEDTIDWLIDLQYLPDKCDPNPCLNNGVCEAKNGKFKCDCPKPFKGKKCQRAEKICKKNRCGHGLCVLTSKPPYYECKCRDPFQLPNCRTVSVCKPSPCKNGGSCIPDENKFKCACPDTFSGKFCHVGPDDCYKDNGESYRGMVSETDDGDDCLFWNSHFLLDKGTDPFTMYENEEGLGPHNYCRNPDGDTKPWCFIRQGKRLKWDYCNVRKCPTTPAGPDGSGEGPPPPVPGEVVTPPGPVEVVTPPGPVEVVTPPGPVEVMTPPGPAEKVTAPAVVEVKPPTEPEKPPAPPTKPVEGTTGTNQTTGDRERAFATCGKPQPSRVLQRVYGGMKAIPGAHPWQVSVQVRPIGSLWSHQHICGGVLIKPCWVLTAGHCIDQQKSMQVVLGGVNLAKVEPSDQTVEVEKVIVHEHYRETPAAVYNDIALLKLKGAEGHCAKETQFVKTVCLPNSTFPDGTECTISGWGATETSNYGSNQLLDAKVQLIPQQRCMSPDVYGPVVDSAMFCAGYLQGGVDSCQGDSGGPLVCVKDQVHYVYGLVSWGDSCARENKPGVYTRLTHFSGWINSHIDKA